MQRLIRSPIATSSKSYLSNSGLISPSCDPHANSLVHPARPYHNTNNLSVLLILQCRLPLTSVELCGIHMLQELWPNAVWQNPLHHAVGFCERIVAFRSRKSRIVFGKRSARCRHGCGCGRFCVDLYGCCVLCLCLGCVKASSACVSLGLLDDFLPRKGPDGQGESSSAHFW